MEFEHRSVLPDECIEALAIKPDGIYVDGTLGGAGHSLEIVKRLVNGKLIAFDQDIEAIENAKKVLGPYMDRVILIHSNFEELKERLEKLGIFEIDGLLLDLGVSSYQLDNPERGFSYMKDAPLDMRMNVENDLSAYHVVNEYGKAELDRILRDYGEENWHKRIAEFIVEKRAEKPIETTGELVDIIKAAVPKAARDA
ncbi:MAG: 16S rRNA (cytosine(1402)-N(4))-methyltransferase RsmH, partial [Peptostreptococcaceae bacterium]|nr:16S rRNA (cytosine(1402)-N(4))-methyltransferase RsmH [Peptostreptococcaceae bacterium]